MVRVQSGAGNVFGTEAHHRDPEEELEAAIEENAARIRILRAQLLLDRLGTPRMTVRKRQIVLLDLARALRLDDELKAPKVPDGVSARVAGGSRSRSRRSRSRSRRSRSKRSRSKRSRRKRSRSRPRGHRCPARKKEITS